MNEGSKTVTKTTVNPAKILPLACFTVKLNLNRLSPEENEIVFVKALKKGDAEAFDQLFSLYGNRIYHFTYGYLKSKEESEEVVQEVFLRIWKNRKTLNPDLSFKAYLFKIAWHFILEYFEKAARRRAYQEKLIEESVNFEHLPPRQKDILIKRRKEGLAVKEIASQLGISPKTVENHLTEALKTIRKQLGEDNISALLLFMLFVKC